MSGILNRTNPNSLMLNEIGNFQPKNLGQNGQISEETTSLNLEYS